MTNSLTIEEINVLQAENDRLKMELATRNQMLMEAHFQNKKLNDELITTQNQYNKVVEQNKEYNIRNMELEKVFKWIKTQQYYILPKGFIKKITEVINEQI
jgi:chromosome segregation ATPase